MTDAHPLRLTGAVRRRNASTGVPGGSTPPGRVGVISVGARPFLPRCVKHLAGSDSFARLSAVPMTGFAVPVIAPHAAAGAHD
jgi:hypothetical protein